jgi:uncharacterized protein YdeI (YjbR/CyaY-like superfamily)
MMTNFKLNTEVDLYFTNTKNWHEELNKLRFIVLDCQLKEELKWGKPCYTHDNQNIILIHAFKKYCALLFFKGALLEDKNEILVQQTENVQASRQIRFTNVKEIVEKEALLIALINKAIEIEKAGFKIDYKSTIEFVIPDEFQIQLETSPLLASAYKSLTPGRKRGYLLYFSAAKQSQTRVSRIEKSIPKIMNGKGLNDCTCGLSKKLPNCDGSHKQLKLKI